MVSRIVGTALVHTEEARGWRVSTVEYPEGRARIEHRSRLTQVLVGDRPVSTEDPAEVTISPGDEIQFLPPFAGG